MAFDADMFMNAVTTEVNDTKIVPCPVGEYNGTISKVQGASGDSEKGAWAKVEVSVDIEGDPTIKQITGLDKKTVRGGIMLDLTESGGVAVGPGKNVKVGRLREAVGLNQPGAPFSFQMLVGKTVRIKVGHRPDKNDPSILYDEAVAFLPVV